MPSVSPEPAELKSTTSGALAFALSGVPLATAVGSWFAAMVIVAVEAVAVAPSLSVTVSVGVNSPSVV